jgi:hypothetical protein
MTPVNRIGTFFIFCGGLALLIFWASLNAPEKSYDFIALLSGAGFIAVGWVMRTAKKPPEPEDEQAEAPPPPPPKKKKARGLFRSKPEKKKPEKPTNNL